MSEKSGWKEFVDDIVQSRLPALQARNPGMVCSVEVKVGRDDDTEYPGGYVYIVETIKPKPTGPRVGGALHAVAIPLRATDDPKVTKKA